MQRVKYRGIKRKRLYRKFRNATSLSLFARLSRVFSASSRAGSPYFPTRGSRSSPRSRSARFLASARTFVFAHKERREPVFYRPFRAPRLLARELNRRRKAYAYGARTLSAHTDCRNHLASVLHARRRLCLFPLRARAHGHVVRTSARRAWLSKRSDDKFRRRYTGRTGEEEKRCYAQ